MALSVKNEVLRDIAMMVRKGSIQFNMNDRPMLDLTRIDKKTGRKIEYCVGSISYDPDYGGLQYTLYTSNGLYVPKVDGPRPLDTLYEKELVAIREKVGKYFDMSICRESNLATVLNILCAEGGNITFPDNDVRPVAYLEPWSDGDLVRVAVDSIFYPDEEYSSERCMMFSAIPFPEDDLGFADVVGELDSLNDNSIANIMSCVMKKYSLETVVKVDKAAEQDADVSKTIRNKMSI